MTPEVSLLDFRISADTGRHVACHDPAGEQHRDAVSQRKHRVHVVFDQQDRELPLELAEQVDHAR